MDLYSKFTKIRLIYIILILLSILIIILSFYYYKLADDSFKMAGILSGLITGFVIALFQIFLDWYGFKQVDKLKLLKIKSINAHRDDRLSYQKLIQEAQTEIVVMGVTADRLIDHFAVLDNNSREETRVLIRTLERGVRIRFLLPEREFLQPDMQNKFDQVTEKISILNKQYPNFECRYFKHIPAHSIFRVDDTCIVGPVFSNLKSRDTPAIHFDSDSVFVKKYLDYFEHEWKNLGPEEND